MLSPGYFDFRWSWYRPILNRGEDIAARCRVDVRRLPVRYTAEDGKEYVPYAMQTDMADVTHTSLRLLYDLSVRYMIEGEKVSAHQLPPLNPVGRVIVKHLQSRYPHLPQVLLHHWCADSQGAMRLFELWQSMWKQSWKQDQVDHAPWVASVNILILKLIRLAIARLPKEHAEHADHIFVCVAGGLYDWALRNFLKQHVDGEVEVTRIATYESMMIPATPIAFLCRQPDNALLGDDRFVIASYGLESDVVPRMRQLRQKVGFKYESGICPLLAEDRMGAHMLRRSWVRLALWELAEKTSQGVWMQWVLNAKKLDQLIARPETLPKAATDLLKISSDFPVVAWILARLDEKTKKRADAETPWLKDDRVLQAFRVFEADVAVEQVRRQAELHWLDRHEALGGRGRSSEIEKALKHAWREGQLIYFQGAEESLHGGASLSAKQACLRMNWASYLHVMNKLHGDFSPFLKLVFLPKILQDVRRTKQVFLDEMSGVGCVLRGSVADVLHVGHAIRHHLHDFYLDLMKKEALQQDEKEPAVDLKAEVPAISICMAMQGDWLVVQYEDPQGSDVRITSSAAMAQADAGLAHDENIGRLIAWRNRKAERQSLGGIHIEGVDIGGGNMLPILHNQGFALTHVVMQAYESEMTGKARIQHFSLDAQQAHSLFSKFRVSGSTLEITVVTPHDESEDVLLFVKVGVTRLNGVTVDIYELLQSMSPAATLMRSEMLMNWSGG